MLELFLGALLLDLLMLDELLLLVLLFLTFTEELFLFDEELELGLTYSELERTCLLLLAGVYVLRSEEDEGLTELLLFVPEGLLYLF